LLWGEGCRQQALDKLSWVGGKQVGDAFHGRLRTGEQLQDRSGVNPVDSLA
jgi:hypothetical protein